MKMSICSCIKKVSTKVLATLPELSEGVAQDYCRKRHSRFDHLGQIKWIPRIIFCLLKGHDLNVETPGREVAIGNGVVQVTDGVVRISGG